MIGIEIRDINDLRNLKECFTSDRLGVYRINDFNVSVTHRSDYHNILITNNTGDIIYRNIILNEHEYNSILSNLQDTIDTSIKRLVINIISKKNYKNKEKVIDNVINKMCRDFSILERELV